MATQILLTLDQYLDMPEEEETSVYELDEGELVEMPAPSLELGAIEGRIFQSLESWNKQTGGAYLVSLGGEFVLGVRTARKPDVCMIRRETYKTLPVRKGSYVGCPDLAAEVVSKNDTARDLDRKTRQYLAAGTRVVWVVYPETLHILAHDRSGGVRSFSAGQTLEEPELLAGFRLSLDELFADL